MSEFQKPYSEKGRENFDRIFGQDKTDKQKGGQDDGERERQ